MPKTGDTRELSYNKLLLSTQEFVGRKSLESTIDEVDRLKDRLAKTDQEKYVCITPHSWVGEGKAYMSACVFSTAS